MKRPWITVGFTALLFLAILAITSPQAMVRKLGKKWTTLHRLIYFAAGIAMLHFIWSQKKDIRTPLLYLGVLAVLLLARLILRRGAGRKKPAMVKSPA